MATGAVWDAVMAESIGTRPGVYIINSSLPTPRPAVTNDGVVLVIGVADWGPVETKVDLLSPTQVNRYLGDLESDAMRATVLEALAVGARNVMFYRVAASAVKAALTLSDSVPAAALTVTAKYEGAFGNELKAEVVTSVNTPGAKDLIIYEGTVPREQFTGVDNDALVADWVAKGSEFVTLAVSGASDRTLANVTATSLTGGDSGTSVTSSDYTDALAAVTQLDFYALAIDTADDAIQAAVRTWVNTERAGGHRVRAFLAALVGDSFSDITTQAAALNSEGVSFLANGFVTASGRQLTPVQASVVVAALHAVNQTASLTNLELPGATDVTRRFTAAEYSAGLIKGVLFLSYDGELVTIEQGLNTLQVASQVAPKSPDWRKTRYIAIQDAFATRAGRKLKRDFIGKVENDERGRQEAVNQVQTVLDEMTEERLLAREPRAVAFLDPRFVSAGDRVYVAAEGQQVDAIEKFFLTVVA